MSVTDELLGHLTVLRPMCLFRLPCQPSASLSHSSLMSPHILLVRKDLQFTDSVGTGPEVHVPASAG